MVKVPGLDGEKMGKSDAENAIGIDMDKDVILARYLSRGVTDKGRTRRNDPGNPWACRAVYPVHELVTDGEVVNRKIARQCAEAAIGCRDCKQLLVDNIGKILEPFQERRKELADQDGLVREILHEGGLKARKIIMPTIEEIADKMGIVTY